MSASGIEQEARQTAAKIQYDAQTEAVATRNAELGSLREQVLQISVAVASRILGESIDAAKQQSLVNSFIAELPADARGLGGSIEVVSAMPLTADEQAQISSEVGASEASFSVDPAILGGLIVSWSGGMVDGSVRSQLSQMAAQPELSQAIRSSNCNISTRWSAFRRVCVCQALAIMLE